MTRPNVTLRPRGAGKSTKDEAPAPEGSVRALTVADTLSSRMKLNAEDRAWLSAQLANSGCVRTYVSVETIEVPEESATDWEEREVVGSYPVGDLYVRVLRDNDTTDLGEFTLVGNWAVEVFNPDGRGRGVEDTVNGLYFCEAFDQAVATAAAAIGFTLNNAGEDDGSGRGYLLRTYELSQ